MNQKKKDIRVLVAEDNILNQRIIEILIKKKGWSCTLVADGSEAVEACANEKYDVVLMDIDMPVMDGWEATIEIRKKDKNIPIIALTAYNEGSFKKKSFEVGMNLFLSKPYNKEEIYEAILKSVH